MVHWHFVFNMPYLSLWIHLVWSTKQRKPLLSDSIRQHVFTHMRENALKKGIHLDFINGFTDHVHCLVSLGPDQTISKIVQLLKGESAFWINKNGLCPEKFEWQGEYWACAVCPSALDRVRRYIKNQEIHHRKKKFEDEYKMMMKINDISLLG